MLPNASIPDASIPNASIPDASIPDASIPDGGIPDGGIPNSGIPNSGIPNGGIPNGGIPNSGIPDAGIPNAGIPSTGNPSTGNPNPGTVVRAAVAAAGEQSQACSDAAWFDRLTSAQAGNAAAVGELIDQVRDYLLLIASRELDGALQAKVSPSDLVQQTMLEAGRDLPAFQGQTSAELNGWLVRILRHNLTDVARQYRGTQRRDIGREIDGLGEKEVPLICDQRSASSICRRVEADEQLDRVVFRLPEQYRQVIHLRHIQDLSWNEVAEQLNISSEAARKLWARTLAKLREELAKDHETSSEPTQRPQP